MENVSKALIMAGSILISIIIISVLVILFSQIGSVYSEEEESLTVEQLEEYNRKFAVYNNTSGLYGSELLSLANLIEDYENKMLYEVDSNSTFYKENKIEVYVALDNSTTVSIDYFKHINELLGEQIATMEANGWNNNSSEHYNEYYSTKSTLTGLRSLLFKCDNSKTEYNKYGRISKMYFEQITY